MSGLARSISAAPESEAVERFACFGGRCAVLVQGSGPAGSARVAAERAKRRLLDWHAQFSRFESSSELSQLNRDPRARVPVSAMMARFVEAAVQAAAITGGLVDPTLLAEVEQAGYAEHFSGAPVTRSDVVRLSPLRRPAGPHPAARWRQVSVYPRIGTVTRPVGVRLDSGGIAKGLFGDILASLLSWHHGFAVVAAGDVRFGGAGGITRPVQVTSPFDDGVLHTFELVRGAAATSGTTKRSWMDDRGRVAHHLLDPATGRPAFTGIVQATALAPSGVEAEALAKAALLSGPELAHRWLPHGGVIVYEDGSHHVVEPQDRGQLG
jgi:thiamine biosynthesis lipoprotein